MRDPKRIRKFCNQLAELWETNCPDWRFGQLIENVMGIDVAPDFFLFYIEDEEMMKRMYEFFNGGKK